MFRPSCWCATGTWLLCCSTLASAAGDLTRDEAAAALHRAVRFFRSEVATGGGYVYAVSSDFSKREGEEKVGPTTAWIQPPGTPAVGMAYLEAWQLTGDPVVLEAAVETGMALVNCQLESGGWEDKIEFGPEERARCAYRVERHESLNKLRNTTTFDDDKSQSALRFLMRLDEALEFKNAAIHEAALYALDAFIQAQYPNGAWPQRYNEFPNPDDYPVARASIPDEWSRTFPADNYKSYYTLNDGTISDLIDTLLEAHDIYGDARYREAALRGGDFFLLAQLPEPQPGWAQQYDRDMHPAWARKFEPPAVTGGESQGVLQTLLVLYRRTGEAKYLEPLPRALEYYRSCVLDDGRLARFYELKTNKPLYFTKEYELTYSSADMPTHYAFIVGSKLDRIERDYNRLVAGGPDDKPRSRRPSTPKLSSELTKDAAEAVATLDERGAWVTEGRLRNYGDDDETREIIESSVFIERLQTLARFIAASE
jgi:hypothetical protein